MISAQPPSRKLNLGCGPFKLPGYLNVDSRPDAQPDMLVDLGELPLPFADNSFDEVLADHVIQNLADPLRVVLDLHRVCAPGAILKIRAPHFSRGMARANHKQGFGASFASYFDPAFHDGFQGCRMDLVKQRLYWFGEPGRTRTEMPSSLYWAGRCAGAVIDVVANLSPTLCSRLWCFWVGGFDEYEMHFRVVKPALAVAANTADRPAAVPLPQRPLPGQPARSARAKSPKVRCALIALLLLAICYGYNRFSLLTGSPYEGWDEIGTYNNAAVITDQVKWRTYAYGTLDTAKMVLARWYYNTYDPLGKAYHFKTYSNNVPTSWMRPEFDFRRLTWDDLSSIDFNYFRGVADRRPIYIAREINLAFAYLLAAIALLSAVMFYGLRGIPLFAALAFLLTSFEMYFNLSYALPNAANALLSFLIVIFCQAAMFGERPRLLYSAAILVACNINHKVDSVMLVVPIAIAAIQVGFWPGRSLRRVCALAGRLTLCFVAALLCTNPYLVFAPLLELQAQASAITVHQGGVNISANVAILWHFLGQSLSLNPGAEVIASHLVIAVLVVVLIALSLLPFAFGRHLSWPQRLGCMALTIVTVGVLFAAPTATSSKLQPRYFLNGWAALLATGGGGLAVVLPRFSRRKLLIPVCIASMLSLGVLGLRFAQIRKSEVAVLSKVDSKTGLDTTVTRNLLALEALRAAKSGEFSRTVLIDQHAYLDLRAFILSGLNPVYINANNYEEVIRGLPAGKYLTLFTKGDYEIQPRWAGLWPDDIRIKYSAYLKYLTSSPSIWEKSGPPAKLLDWAPPHVGDNMFLGSISLSQNGSRF